MKKLLLIILLLIPINIKAIDTSATSIILMDQDSKRILYAKNIHEVRSIASISKIMTAIVAIENGNLKKQVTIGNEIDSSYGSGIYIKKGEKLTIEDLLYGLMLRSGNDAAAAISYHSSKSVDNFISKMNNLASKLNMKDTTFNNPSGLDEENGNYSTAYDMALLTSYAMKNKTYKQIVKTKKYQLTTNKNTYVWHNKNKLLNTYKYTTGGKTGFTKKAKRTLVTTASKNNLNLVVVSLNDGNDFNDHKALFEYGFSNYENFLILKKGQIKIANENYYKNKKLYIKKNIYYPLTKSEKNSIQLDYKIEKKRSHKNNSKIGKVNIKLGDKIITSTNLYVKK